MKTITTCFIAVMLCLSAFAKGVSEGGEKKVIPFADPFILYEDGLYYLYGTGSDSGIPVVVSEDMETWKWPDGKNVHLALHRDDTYGHWLFWAPEVYHIGNKYIMYYSSHEHICVAESDSPLGPFRQMEQKPMRDHKGIDNHLFIDEDGTPYIFWVHFNHGNEIWLARLEDDFKTIVPGSEKFCIRMSQDWEKVWPSVNEGPFVLKHKGMYYMTYSANSYESPSYGVGFATTTSLDTPWEKYSGNPILQFYNSLEGVGHHAFFKDKDGKLRIVFHSHNKPGQISPRIIHIAEARFKSGRIVISKKYMTPEME